MTSANLSSNSNARKKPSNTLYVVRAIYLGSEPMGELLDGENGSDAVQVPLKRTILRTEGVGDEVDLIISDEALCVNFIKYDINDTTKSKFLQLPIESLAYCGALRQLPPEKVKDREFETLDKTPSDPKLADPPLFVTIFRSADSSNTLLCHSFVIRKDLEAMELVKHVMQVYYTIIEHLEQVDAAINKQFVQQQAATNGLNRSSSVSSQHAFQKTNVARQVNNLQSKSFTTAETTKNGLTQAELDRLLDTYNRTAPNVSKATSAVGSENIYTSAAAAAAATSVNGSKIGTSILNNQGASQFVVDGKTGFKDIESLLNGNLDPSEYAILQEAFNGHTEVQTIMGGEDYSNIPLNQDEDPIIIKKKNDEKVCYKQNVYVRWLQPPTPPPPAPIIIREVQEPPEQLPPLVIYKQPPREPTPPPLIIREKPPSPLPATEPIIIERRVAPEQARRRIIVEELPAVPKPRDIILEKWLPREQKIKRQVIIEKVASSKDRHYLTHNQSPIYEYQHYDSRRPYYQNQNYQNHYDYYDKHGGVYHHQPVYDIYERHRTPAKKVVRHILRPALRESTSFAYKENYRGYSPTYSTHHYMHNHLPRYHRPRLAGYRVIRQIIPGPNATPADIEKAIIRSQRLGESNYAKYVDTNIYANTNYPIYTHDTKPITVAKTYIPHNNRRSRKIYKDVAESVAQTSSVD